MRLIKYFSALVFVLFLTSCSTLKDFTPNDLSTTSISKAVHKAEVIAQTKHLIPRIQVSINLMKKIDDPKTENIAKETEKLISVLQNIDSVEDSVVFTISVEEYVSKVRTIYAQAEALIVENIDVFSTNDIIYLSKVNEQLIELNEIVKTFETKEEITDFVINSLDVLYRAFNLVEKIL